MDSLVHMTQLLSANERQELMTLLDKINQSENDDSWDTPAILLDYQAARLKTVCYMYISDYFIIF